jgi:hypothetical protein
MAANEDRRVAGLNRRTLAVVGGALAVTSLLIALDRMSFAAMSGVPFVDRFGDVWQEPDSPGSPVLALQTPEPTGVSATRALPTEIRIKGRVSDSALNPSPGLAPARRAATASNAVPAPTPAPANRQVATAEPQLQRPVSDARVGVAEADSTFTLPDLGPVAVPVAAVGLTALSIEELLRDRPWGGTVVAFVPPPATAPVRPQLPGPFHVFLTTDSAGTGSGGASDAAAASGSGVVGGVVSGVGNTVNGVVGTAVGTAGGVVSTVGSVAGAVLRKR